MKKQVGAVVYTTLNKIEVFDTYEKAWKFSQKIFENTGKIAMVEVIYAAN